MNNDEILNDKSLYAQDKQFLKKRANGLWLSDEDINILSEYHIEYSHYKTLQELIFAITEVINNQEEDSPKLMELNIKLEEYNYYNYINK